MKTTTLGASVFAATALNAAAFAAAPAALDVPTFTQDVAAILHENCASCHSPGQVAPMSLRTYEEARPWAKSILRAVQEREMPPWDADPGFGPFANDRSLTDQEVETIVRWAGAGAPRGEGEAPDPPPLQEGEWTLGEPDWVLEFDPFEVAADGADQFLQTTVETGFDTDRWISAIEVLPGDRQVVHHFLLWQSNESRTAQESLIGGWAAGANQEPLPEGTGRLLKKGHALIGDFHYHPNGTASTDRTRVGIHFADPEVVEKELVNLWILNAEFEIPAGDPDYGASASHVFPQDGRILGLTPHMHYRGKDMTYTATYPDGHRETLLRVSNYDFNWQTGYEFAEPIEIPAGTRIDVAAHWDNSADNPANPDPTRDVTWGTESTDEMLIGFVDYVVAEGISPKPVSLVLGKLAELAESHPGRVWRVDIEREPGKGPEPSAIHLPLEGPGGWYVQFGNMVLPAPINDIVWDGSRVTAKAMVPGQQMEVEGTVDEATGELDLTLITQQGEGQIKGTPAEKAKAAAVLPAG
ncbi:MAG TPA: cytochrome c [Thermoanaerobaculia bacterium]|nr:cytochrome c [Thermoanaerobaculia bacterium]